MKSKHFHQYIHLAFAGLTPLFSCLFIHFNSYSHFTDMSFEGRETYLLLLLLIVQIIFSPVLSALFTNAFKALKCLTTSAFVIISSAMFSSSSTTFSFFFSVSFNELD